MQPEKPLQHFSIFHGFFSPFFSKEFYIDVAQNWRWKSFLFLVMVTVVITIPTFSNSLHQIDAELQKELPKILEKMPTIEIEDGIASVAGVEQPTEYILLKESDIELILVVDLEATKDSVEKTITPRSDTVFMTLTKNNLFVTDPTGEISEMSLPKLKEKFVISKENGTELASSLLKVAVYVVVPFVIFFTIVSRLFFAFIAALLIDSMRSKEFKLPFSGAMSLGILVMTPAILLYSLLTYIEVSIPFSWLIYTLITFGYIKFALSAVDPGAKGGSTTTI